MAGVQASPASASEACTPTENLSARVVQVISCSRLNGSGVARGNESNHGGGAEGKRRFSSRYQSPGGATVPL